MYGADSSPGLGISNSISSVGFRATTSTMKSYIRVKNILKFYLIINKSCFIYWIFCNNFKRSSPVVHHFHYRLTITTLLRVFATKFDSTALVSQLLVIVSDYSLVLSTCYLHAVSQHYLPLQNPYLCHESQHRKN